MLTLVPNSGHWSGSQQPECGNLPRTSLGHRIIGYAENAMLEGDELAAIVLSELAYSTFDNDYRRFVEVIPDPAEEFLSEKLIEFTKRIEGLNELDRSRFFEIARVLKNIELAIRRLIF